MRRRRGAFLCFYLDCDPRLEFHGEVLGEAGVPLLVIKQFLGHAHLSTTEIYAKMGQSTVNEKLKGWDEEYWHDQYIDSLEEKSMSETTQNNTPDFLK